ncbi:hypothetical protein [Microbulbifer thermotolerans]|uniref:hypothetical protein n=1 Tax=Microbulbifer thermotolerans TaxID=252514 RepID=UPI00224B9705|nr:hypothetical protein [Microbulbifer thermotolerans]MCX2780653.1 hypothetical protein [Microbulbifer thermotolerans]MCX2806359.1 hypothetical protein [Microbulbifer thermotolerans]
MRINLLVAVMFFCSSTFSADFSVEICALQAMGSSDTALLKVCETRESYNQCGDGSWVAWDMSQFQGKAMYSTALTAFSMGKKIRLRLDGSSCSGSYDITSMIRIEK